MGVLQSFHFFCINQLEFSCKELFLNSFVTLKYITSHTWGRGALASKHLRNWGANAVVETGDKFAGPWDPHEQESREAFTRVVRAWPHANGWQAARQLQDQNNGAVMLGGYPVFVAEHRDFH